jgi:hypothetical protein
MDDSSIKFNEILLVLSWYIYLGDEGIGNSRRIRARFHISKEFSQPNLHDPTGP